MTSVPHVKTGRRAPPAAGREMLQKWEHVELLERDFDDLEEAQLTHRRRREKVNTKLEREA